MTTTTTTTARIHNFSAGPAVLPVEVLEQVQRDLLSLPGVGMSVLEISHRSAAFEEILEGCEADVRKLAGVPDGYHVLFLQGGASLQFSMVPMNLLPQGGSADYVVTGVWAQKAVKEAKRVGSVKIAGIHRSRQLQPRPQTAGAEARSRRGVRSLHDQQHDLRNTVFLYAGDRQRSARRRRILGHFQQAHRRGEIRSRLRRRTEEPRARGRDSRHHPRRFARSGRQRRCRRCCSTACTWRTSRCTTRRRCSRFTSCGSSCAG